MNRARIIPVLLLHKGGLYKTARFNKPIYVGDPINAVKIFNEKEIDEIVVLDIDASREERGPNFEQLAEIASEAFVPLAYGGGVRSVDDAQRLFYLGTEKVILNYTAFNKPALISQIANRFGTQSVVVSIDYKRNFFGKPMVYTLNGKHSTRMDPVTYAKKMVGCGAGEIILNCIERDGTYAGYDIETISVVSAAIPVPLIALGGASSLEDLRSAIHAGASAAAAGSMFVFQRPHQAVLINYPNQILLERFIFGNL
jgi:cyclase